MATNPNIILAGGQGRPQSVDYNSARNIVEAGDALKSKQEQQDRQETMRTQQAFQSALQQTGGDYYKAADLLDAQGHNTLGLREGLAKQQKAATDAAAAHLTQLEKQNELMSGYAANITDQESLRRYGPLLHSADPEIQIPMTYVGNEAYFKGLGSLGKTGQDVLNRAKDSLAAYKNGDAQTGFAKAIWGSTSDEDVQGAIQFAKTQGVPDYVINSVVPAGTKWSPELTQRAQMLAMGPKEAYDAQQKADKPAPVGSDYHQYAERWAREHWTTFENLTTKQEQQARKEYGQADDKPARSSVTTSNANETQARNDVKTAVSGMKAGHLPPILPGRASKDYTALLAESERQGFDLVKANEDWVATQSYLKTLNGAQQTRLRQAVVQVKESVPLVRSLIKEWDSSGLPGLSAANLAAAASGAYGQKQQSLARRLKAQIADMTSELGTVYKGGNSSTDESLKLAAENLSADWGKQTGLDALDQIEQNIRFRQNSMRLPPVTNEDNPYAPKLAGTPTPKRQNWVFDSKGQLVPGP